MASSGAAAGDKDPTAVEINIETIGSEVVPDAGRTTAQDSGRGRRLNPPANGATNNTNNTNNTGRRSRSNSRSPGRRAKRDTEMSRTDAIPLLPIPNEANLPRQQPPMAGPELDDEDGDSVDNAADFDPKERDRGIDNGFLEPSDDRTNGGGGKERGGGGGGGRGRADGGRRVPQTRTFPDPAGFAPGAAGTVLTTERGQVIPDVNVYQQKKNLAQGMMDLALLSANANQLRYVLETYTRHPYFYVNLIFISTSIIAQVAVGIGLIWKSRYNIWNENDFCKADRLNNLITIGIFIITIVNVLISAFGVAEPQT